MPTPAQSELLPFTRRFARLLIGFLTVSIFLGILIVPVELNAPGSDFRTTHDGLWWALSTAAATGYSSFAPVTLAGLTIALILRILGWLFFAGIVGLISLHFYRIEAAHHHTTMRNQLDRLEDELKTLKSKLDFLIKNQRTTRPKPPQWGL